MKAWKRPRMWSADYCVFSPQRNQLTTLARCSGSESASGASLRVPNSRRNLLTALGMQRSSCPGRKTWCGVHRCIFLRLIGCTRALKAGIELPRKSAHLSRGIGNCALIWAAQTSIRKSRTTTLTDARGMRTINTVEAWHPAL